MNAILLAAGMGTRLGPYTKDLPKGMLAFDGVPLIERQVQTLRECGIRNIVIVRGYQAEKIKISGVRYYQNDHYANTNMVHSLFCAEAEMNGDLLICYTDILYQKSVLQTVLASTADIGVTIDEEYWEYWRARLDHPEEDTESMVLDRDGKIIELGEPQCEPEKARARYVGLIKCSHTGVEVLKKVYHENRKRYGDSDNPWMRSKSFKKAYMTCLLQAIIDAGYRVDPIIIRHGWMEFDTVADYERATRWLQTGEIDRFIQL